MARSISGSHCLTAGLLKAGGIDTDDSTLIGISNRSIYFEHVDVFRLRTDLAGEDVLILLELNLNALTLFGEPLE